MKDTNEVASPSHPALKDLTAFLFICSVKKVTKASPFSKTTSALRPCGNNSPLRAGFISNTVANTFIASVASNKVVAATPVIAGLRPIGAPCTSSNILLIAPENLV